MDINLRKEVKDIKSGVKCSTGEAIDRVAVSREVYWLRAVRVGKAQVVVKKARLFEGVNTAFMKALPL